MLTALMVGLSIGLLYVLVPAPIDLVAAQRGLRFGPGAGVAAQLGSMAADGLCAALALGVLAPATTDTSIRIPMSIGGLAILLLVTASTVRSVFRPSGAARVPAAAPGVARPSYLANASWGAFATIASPFPLAYWTSLGASLSRFAGTERWVVGLGFVIVDLTWAFGFPYVVASAPRVVPPALRLRAPMIASLAAVGMACFFGVQLASSVA